MPSSASPTENADKARRHLGDVLLGCRAGLLEDRAQGEEYFRNALGAFRLTHGRAPWPEEVLHAELARGLLHGWGARVAFAGNMGGFPRLRPPIIETLSGCPVCDESRE